MTDDRGEEEARERARLSDTSDELLRALTELRDLERRKRDKTISTPEFHELADRIDARSKHIFRIAAAEREMGESLDTQTGAENDTIADIARDRNGDVGGPDAADRR